MFRRRGAWLDCWLLKGNSGFTAADAERLRNADTWLPRRWEWVDPEKDQNANRIAVEMGWKTSSDVAAEQGKDYYANISTLKQEREWKRLNGIPADGGGETNTAAEADAKEKPSE
jgi:capsid protein